jgi:hypothetical protein
MSRAPTRLGLERDDGPWYVIDGTGLERVADTNNSARSTAERILHALRTGELPHGWIYEPPGRGPGLRYGKLHLPGGVAHIWLPHLTALEGGQ